MLRKAAAHKGTAFVEILQNCNIFNDGAWDALTEKDVRDDHTIALEHGKPLIFGKNKDKGIRMNGLDLEVVTLGNGVVGEGPDRPRRAEPEPGLRLPALADGRRARVSRPPSACCAPSTPPSTKTA